MPLCGLLRCMAEFLPIPNILDRSPGYAMLMFRNSPDITAYRVRVADSLDNAYGTFNGVAGTGTEPLFDVTRGGFFRSNSVAAAGKGLLDTSRRGQTIAVYDPNDFYNPPTTTATPPDVQMAFLRVQVRPTGGAFPGGATNLNQSSICIMADPEFFSVPRPSLTLGGTAPDLGGAVLGMPPPPEALFFHVPAYGDAMVVVNLEPDGGDPLFISTGRHQPLAQVNANSSVQHASGMKDEIAICANGANPKFAIFLSLVSGQR